jgi:hypothetical protein
VWSDTAASPVDRASRPAIAHFVVMALLAFIIPRCACMHPETSLHLRVSARETKIHLVFWVPVLWLPAPRAEGREFEEALAEPGSFTPSMIVLVIMAVAAGWRTRAAESENPAIQFEDDPAPALQTLGVFRDGLLLSPRRQASRQKQGSGYAPPAVRWPEFLCFTSAEQVPFTAPVRYRAELL